MKTADPSAPELRSKTRDVTARKVLSGLGSLREVTDRKFRIRSANTLVPLVEPLEQRTREKFTVAVEIGEVQAQSGKINKLTGKIKIA